MTPLANRKRKVEIVPGTLVPVLYVNHIHIDVSSVDIRMRLGQIHGATPDALQVKELAHMYMSHEHFMALVAVIPTSFEKMKRLRSIVR